MAHQAGTSSAPPHRDDGGYDVFLNFRGPDSRHTVADVLYDVLFHAGFRVFLDNEEIRKGEVIGEEILSAIISSKIYVPIFSKNYASSKWCLREIAYMVDLKEKSKDGDEKVILPVFFDVDASDVKLNTELYCTALREHEGESPKEATEQWKEALRKVARIKGFNLKDHGVVRLADIIKEEVFNKLKPREAVASDIASLVGIHDRVEGILNMLKSDNDYLDAKFIVIHGVGGIGKTTAATYIFKKISSDFHGSCILYDVGQSSSEDYMVKLQQKLLSNTLHLKSFEVSNIRDGIENLSWKLRKQRVLIVLDNVDKRDHIVNLAAKSSWFGPKSRIIITTRNIGFLQTNDSEDYSFYEMGEMNRGQALQLFCRHAFETDFPLPKYYDISSAIVATTGGLPLALEVIGRSLYNQDFGIWKFTLDKLKEAPHEDVEKALMISYEALEKEQQYIFLDIACFFNNEKKKDPIYFWEACKLYPDSGISTMVQRSLIKVIDDGKLWMHDQLRDLGRAIVQCEIGSSKSLIYPIKPRRIWSPEVALDVIRKRKGVESVVALQLGLLGSSCNFVREELEGLVNLKFLQLQGGNFEGDLTNVFRELRWLSWFECPLKIKAINLSFKNLVVLKLSGSQITEHWDGWNSITGARQLKVLSLTGCPHMTKTPNFSAFSVLERLILKECSGLEEIDKSVSKLKHLDYLTISHGSSNFVGGYLQDMPQKMQLLPNSIGSLKSLKVLKINSPRLIELPHSIGELANLKHLRLRSPRLENLPPTIGKLKSLIELDISFSGIKELPDSIGDLEQLNILRMRDNGITCLPNSIGRLESLKELDLSDTKIIALPETIENLKRLKVINLSGSSMRKLPKALGKVENLMDLDASLCKDMDDELPEEIGKLSRLRILNLYKTKVSRVPTTINKLSHLQQLVLGEFYEPQTLPELPMSLKSLEVAFSSLELHRVPDLSNMTNLVTLKLLGGTNSKSVGTLQPCVQTRKMEWLVRLAKVEKLTMVLSNLILPPTDLSSLSLLHMLDITCFDPKSLTHLPSSLESLTLHDIELPSKWQFLSGLNNLSTLKLHRCWYREIQADDFGQLRNLRNLELVDCGFVERLSNVSCLEELRKLEIENCPYLVYIQGLGEVKLLRSLSMMSCRSIQWLPELSNLKNLEKLCFRHCESLDSIPDVGEETQCYLQVLSCEQFADFRGPYERQKKRKRRIGGNNLCFLFLLACFRNLRIGVN